MPPRFLHAPALELALEVACKALLLALCGAGLGLLVALADRGSLDLDPRELLGLLAPVSLAAGTALAVGRRRLDGSWDGLLSIGYSPAGLLTLGLLLALLGGGVQGWLGLRPGGPSGAGTVFALLDGQPPLPRAARWTFDGDRWREITDPRWQVPPAALSTPELAARLRAEPPPGARAAVDRGELLRRLAWAAAWPIGLLWAVAFTLRSTATLRRGSGRNLGAAVAGSAGPVALLLLLSLVLAAACS